MKKSIFPFITIMLTVVAFFTIRRASAQKKRIAQRNLEDAEQIVTPVSTKATPLSLDTVAESYPYFGEHTIFYCTKK
jgi:biopolymer transport protein ExbD